MSRPLVNKTENEKLVGLLTVLKNAEEQPSKETVQLSKSTLREALGLVERVLSEKPIVLEKDLSPNETAEILGVSRSMIMHYLETGKLKGYEVGSHWRISKESVHHYLEERNELMKMFGEMDKAGFGLD